jgi:hypothetical protein
MLSDKQMMLQTMIDLGLSCELFLPQIDLELDAHL